MEPFSDKTSNELECIRTELMNFIVPVPSEINNKFWEKYQVSLDAALEYLYHISQKVTILRLKITKKMSISNMIQNMVNLKSQSILQNLKKIPKILQN